MLVEPVVTTILPTYRRPTLLKRAVFSALQQSFGNFVIQILDNASGDDTEDVARELMRLDPRIRYVRHPENIGSLNNMIWGMERVETPYFNILCDDDLLMPEFCATTVSMLDAGDRSSAFVSTRVLVLDETGRVTAPFMHPAERLRLTPPEGLGPCIKWGVSLPGVMYRKAVMSVIGPPRTAWWNWTESGWHALAALRSPVEFAPEAGAIMFNHQAGGSKRMDGMEFRISWFRMLAEVRETAAQLGVTAAVWNRHLQTHQRSVFASCCLRVCRDGDAKADKELREFGIRSGLNATAVASAVRIAKAVRGIGAGRMVNGGIDWMLKRREAADVSRRERSRQPLEPAITSAVNVVMQLNRQAGVAPSRAV